MERFIAFCFGATAALVFVLAVDWSTERPTKIDAVKHGAAQWVVVPGKDGNPPSIEFKWNDEIEKEQHDR